MEIRSGIIIMPEDKQKVIEYADFIKKSTQSKVLRKSSDSKAKEYLNQISAKASKIIQIQYKQVEMPTFFNDWYKQQMKSVFKTKMSLIMNLSFLIIEDMPGNQYDFELREWIFEGNEISTIAYAKCIDAINNGYTVKKMGK